MCEFDYQFFDPGRPISICRRHLPSWQQESFDHIVRDGPQLDRIRDYIENNPVKARLAKGEYAYYKCDWLT